MRWAAEIAGWMMVGAGGVAFVALIVSLLHAGAVCNG